MKNYIVGTIIFIISFSATSGELSEFVQRKINIMLEELEFSEKNNSSESYQLSKMRLRLRAKAAIEVPFISKFEVRPLLEMHFKPKKY